MTHLVLVHGFMGGSAQWAEQVAALCGRFDVIAVDLPGFGKAAHLPALANIRDFADWVIQHLRDRGVERYHLLGHSMGGMIAQEIAHRDAARVDQLILYGTGSVGVLPGRFETIAQSKARAREDGASATARRIAATWFLYRDGSTAFEACAQIAQCASQEAIQSGLDAMEHWSSTDYLQTLTPETLLIWGDQDRTYSWTQIETLWRTIPDTHLAVLPHCAHAVHLENPEAFNKLLLNFLQDRS